MGNPSAAGKTAGRADRRMDDEPANGQTDGRTDGRRERTEARRDALVAGPGFAKRDLAPHLQKGRGASLFKPDGSVKQQILIGELALH